MSNIWFRMMAFEFKIRDFFHPRQEIVSEIELRSGFQVLDYGCGPGGYVFPVAKAIGPSGTLYALDAMPLAIEMVKKTAAKKGLKNVKTILSECNTGLLHQELDVVLLYDVFHDLIDKKAVLSELNRVLKPNGLLSFSDHHMKEKDIIEKITDTGLFRFQNKNKHTYSFTRKN